MFYAKIFIKMFRWFLAVRLVKKKVFFNLKLQIVLINTKKRLEKTWISSSFMLITKNCGLNGLFLPVLWIILLQH